MPRNETKFSFRTVVGWTAVVGWMTLIFWLSSMSDPGLPSGWSSPAHFTTYGVLSALCMLALGPGVPPARAAGISLLISSAYGVTDEIHQSLVPNRVPDIVDWGFDTLGALAGAIAVILLMRLLESSAGKNER